MHNQHTTSFRPWWRNNAEDDPDQELIRGLQSMDPTQRLLAEVWLVENGEVSMEFLEQAITDGAVDPVLIGGCMAEILRRKLAGELRSGTTWLVTDASCA